MSRAVRTSASSKAADAKSNAFFLKNRVEELEAEVISLKKRLDDLRKAKNTTVHKKQKEYVTMSNAEQKASDDLKVGDLQRRMDDLTLKHSKEMEDLKRSHGESLQKLKEAPSSSTPCNHEEEIAALQRGNRDLRSENEQLGLLNEELRTENGAMREKFEELFAELSIKEAHWCEKEEQLNLKMKLQWGEKYREWMEMTEKKIADLQAANDLLRSYMKKQDR